MAIRTCFFDMGNVLVFFSHEKMCQNVSELAGITIDKVREILIEEGLQWKIERGEISEEEFHLSFQQSAGTEVGFEQLKHATADIFELNESIVPLLDELKALGVRLVLLSNTSVTHLRFIQQNFDVLERFDALTTSFQAGALKPDAAIYEDALSKAECEASECFFTDDIEKYVMAAREFGINAEVYTDTGITRQVLSALGVDLKEDSKPKP